MNTRRDFLKTAFGAGAAAIAPLEIIQRAFAIEPAPGSTVFDAEHVVILMQENRSFDHTFGTLSGVRGFNDPRAIRLPDGNPVWVQSHGGKSHVPFRLDLLKSKTTWMGSLPHSWDNQVDAANGGKHDGWLGAKKSGNKNYSAMPLTLGYHTREDLPFYHALADAFTVCDQNFCSTLTGTTPNRLHLWTGTIREKQSADSPALVRNENCCYRNWVNWPTFPERLEDAGISWKIYQNELTTPTGLTGEADAWLANFEDNPIEAFLQFHVRFHPKHQEWLEKQIAKLTAETAELEKKGDSKDLSTKKEELKRLTADRDEFTPPKFVALSEREKQLHAKAFVTNLGDPAYRELAAMEYDDGKQKRSMNVPKGDILHQFRKDVDDGKLPAVSWLVPPEALSDHPSSAWYGSWYLSEVMAILTKNPEVWRKTVFILTYDENDGYFDHVPPFQAPHPKKPETGLATPGLRTDLEQVELADDRKAAKTGVRGNAIGLGFRVPMLIASPWSRGGCVCSQVFDHTSVIQFLERLFSKKTGKPLQETNINSWRRALCGDLTSAFRTAADPAKPTLRFQDRDAFFAHVHKAQFESVPDGYDPLSTAEIAAIRSGALSRLPQQEPGKRPSSPLPYELACDGQLSDDREEFRIRFAAGNQRFGDRSAGAGFIVYAESAQGLTVRHYSVAPGHELRDAWRLKSFRDGKYRIRVHGPNGFYREFAGSRDGVSLDMRMNDGIDGTVSMQLTATGKPLALRWSNTYDRTWHRMDLRPGCIEPLRIITDEHSGWYDMLFHESATDQRLLHAAGRVETGQWSITDPLIAQRRVSS